MAGAVVVWQRQVSQRLRWKSKRSLAKEEDKEEDKRIVDGEKYEDVVTCFSPTIKVFVQISTAKLLHPHLVYHQE